MNDVRKLNHRNGDISKEIVTLFQRSYQVEAKLIDVLDFPPLKRKETDIANATSEFYGLYEARELIALAEVEPASEEILQIYSLVVEPEHFRKGHAESLILWILNKFKQNRVEVETAAKNSPAIKLYRKLGFKKCRSWMSPEGIKQQGFELINTQKEKDN